MKSHIAIDINNEACDSKSSKAGIEDSCPVCMEIFKNCQKIFEYLPCHHFCCEVCTVKMKKFRQIEFKFLECPLCRETVTKKIELVPQNNTLVQVVNQNWSLEGWKEQLQDFIESKTMLKICWIVLAIVFILFIVLPYILPYLLQDVEPEASNALIRKLDRLLPPKWQHYEK